MNEEEKKEVEEIDKQLISLGKPEIRSPYILGVVLGIVFFGIGIILLAVGLVTYIGIGLAIGGGVMAGFGLIIGIVMGIRVGKISEKNEKIQELNRRKYELSSNEALTEETNEDTLLRLLSEGKITTEEYKKLSKNK